MNHWQGLLLAASRNKDTREKNQRAECIEVEHKDIRKKNTRTQALKEGRKKGRKA